MNWKPIWHATSAVQRIYCKNQYKPSAITGNPVTQKGNQEHDSNKNNQFDVRFLFPLNFSQYFICSSHSMADLFPTTVSPRLIYDNYLATSNIFEEYKSPQILTSSLKMYLWSQRKY